MTARGKAQYRNSVWVDCKVFAAVANQAHRPLSVSQWDIRPVRPALSGQAVEQDKGRESVPGQPTRHSMAFIVDDEPSVTPARGKQDCRAIWALWVQN